MELSPYSRKFSGNSPRQNPYETKTTFIETEDTLMISVAMKNTAGGFVVQLLNPSTLSIQNRKAAADVRQILEKRDVFVLQAYAKLIHTAPCYYQQRTGQKITEQTIHLPVPVQMEKPEVTVREGILHVILKKTMNTQE